MLGCLRACLLRRPSRFLAVLIAAWAFLTLAVFLPGMSTEYEDPGIARREYRHKEKVLKTQILRLKAKINDLQKLLASDTYVARQPPVGPEGPQQQPKGEDLQDDINFQSFNRKGIYAVSTWFDGAGERDPARETGGFRGAIKEDLNAAANYVIHEYNDGKADGFMGDILSNRRSRANLTTDHFIGGIYRVKPNVGIEYEIHFEDPLKSASGQIKRCRLNLLKPFQPLRGISAEAIRNERHTVNIILPLKGRVKDFKRFLAELLQVASTTDANLHLTVVYFGSDGLSESQAIAQRINAKFWRERTTFLTLNSSTFSRGLGIQYGVEHWSRGDNIMFFSDVDVVFHNDFIDRCITYTKQGKRAYSPIVFSLYNPQIVDFFNGRRPFVDRDHLSKQKGFWRDFGYGMTCIYKSDFLSVGGYRLWKESPSQSTGWGFEDMDLYRRLVYTKHLTVVRAPDPGIFHLWHRKSCSRSLPRDRYIDCRKSQVVNEATHQQLGLLHISDWAVPFRQRYGTLKFD